MNSHTDVIAVLAGPALAPRLSQLFHGSAATEYLLAQRGQRQVWNAVVAASILGAVCPEVVTGKHLLKTKCRKLLVEAYGVNPNGLITCLAKLGPIGLAPETYKKLFDILVHGGPHARSLWHSKAITAEEIDRLHRLLAFSGDMVLEACSKPEEAGFLRWLQSQPSMKRQSTYFSQSAWPKKYFFHDAYGLEKDDAHFFRYLWKVLHANTWQFPEYPWPGTEKLRAIHDSKSLHSAAVTMHNCLRHHVKFALAGNSAYYQWCGREPAVVQIKRLPPWGWVLWGIGGIRNGAISEETHRCIIAELATAPAIYSGWSYRQDPKTSKCLDIPRFVLALQDALAMDLA